MLLKQKSTLIVCTYIFVFAQAKIVDDASLFQVAVYHVIAYLRDFQMHQIHQNKPLRKKKKKPLTNDH